MPKLKKWLFRFLLSGFTLLVCLVLVDVMLHRLSTDHEVPRWLVPSEAYGHFQEPNFSQVYSYRHTNVTWTARINRYGLRGPDYDLARTDDRRVLFVGDSFTFGYGLDEDFIFPTLVGRRLAQLFTNETWTVINAGVGGWGTHQQLKHAEANLALFRPDVVVLTFCDNDIQDDILFLKGKASGLLPGFPGKQWLRDNSFFYRMAYAQLSGLLFKEALGKDVKRDNEEAKRVESPHVQDQSNPGGPDILRPNAHLWPRTLDRTLAFHDRLIRQNPVALLIIQQAQPLRGDIYGELRALDNGSSLRYLHLGVDVEGWSDQNVLLPYDPHWRKEVHELSSERIANVMADQIVTLGVTHD